MPLPDAPLPSAKPFSSLFLFGFGSKMMKFAAVAASALAAIAQSASIPLVTVQPTYESWCAQFGKCDGLTADRAAVYADNVAFMDAHNAKFMSGSETYDVGVNEFSAMTHAEFLAHFNLGKVDMHRNVSNNVVTLPTVHHLHGQADSVDWRTKGAVSKVKNQGQCGSCWSFSTTGSTEGRIAIAAGSIPGGETGLSEQQLMDCSKAEGNQGCQGGLMDDAFKYIVKNGGLDSETDYPYKGKNGKCNKKAQDVGVIADYKDVAPNSEDQLAAAVAEGPVSVAIEADQRSFQSYKSGTMSGKCGKKLDHGVLAVGYGDDYWIVKNSWGATWGMDGYIQLARGGSDNGKAGQCGIAAQPSYPTVKKAGLFGLARPLAGPYEDPNNGGCSSGEEAVQITGLTGSFCSPKCSASSPCPANPSGAAKAQCVLETSGSQTPTQCALICDPSADTGACPGTATCKAIQGTGLCTYNN